MLCLKFICSLSRVCLRFIYGSWARPKATWQGMAIECYTIVNSEKQVVVLETNGFSRKAKKLSKKAKVWLYWIHIITYTYNTHTRIYVCKCKYIYIYCYIILQISCYIYIILCHIYICTLYIIFIYYMIYYIYILHYN